MTGQCRRRIGTIGCLLVLPLAGLAPGGCRAPTRAAAAYHPQTRQVTLTAVPLLTREMRAVYPFLNQDFSPGGVLMGKEVYAFVPGTVTAIEGDTLQFELVNPEDDLHSFVLPPDLSVAMPGLSTTSALYVARRAGVFTFTCSIPAHLPAMWGQLVVLSPVAIGLAAQDSAEVRLPVR